MYTVIVYAPNSDPEDESSLADVHKPDFVEQDESTLAGSEQDIWDDDEEEDFR